MNFWDRLKQELSLRKPAEAPKQEPQPPRISIPLTPPPTISKGVRAMPTAAEIVAQIRVLTDQLAPLVATTLPATPATPATGYIPPRFVADTWSYTFTGPDGKPVTVTDQDGRWTTADLIARRTGIQIYTYWEAYCAKHAIGDPLRGNGLNVMTDPFDSNNYLQVPYSELVKRYMDAQAAQPTPGTWISSGDVKPPSGGSDTIV